MVITAVCFFGIFFWHFCMVLLYNLMSKKHLYAAKHHVRAILMARFKSMLSCELFVNNVPLQIIPWLLFSLHWQSCYRIHPEYSTEIPLHSLVVPVPLLLHKRGWSLSFTYNDANSVHFMMLSCSVFHSPIPTVCAAGRKERAKQ